MQATDASIAMASLPAVASLAAPGEPASAAVVVDPSSAVRAELVTKDLEPRGWYIGKIKLYGVSEACKKACPSANFLVKYTKKETGSALEGDEAPAPHLASFSRGRSSSGRSLMM